MFVEVKDAILEVLLLIGGTLSRRCSTFQTCLECGLNILAESHSAKPLYDACWLALASVPDAFSFCVRDNLALALHGFEADGRGEDCEVECGCEDFHF